MAEIGQAGSDAAAGDVRHDEVARRLVATTVGWFGRLDVAFNAGSTGAFGSVADVTLGGRHEAPDTNLTSAFRLAKHQVPAMLRGEGGSPTLTSSFVGHTVGFAGLVAYASAKAGLIGLAQVLAAEHGPQGIRANVLLPGRADTPGAGPGVRAFVEGLHALKRLAAPEGIAQAALFLASDASSFVTGAALRADGGVSMSRT